MLITAAPLWTALPIASPEASQVISPSVPGTVAQRDVERPRAGPDAEDADPVLRRGGDRRGRGAVQVGHRRAGERGEVRIARPLGVRGVGGGVDERDQRALRRDRRRRRARGRRRCARQSLGATESGSSGTARSRLRRTFGLRVDEQVARLQRGRERARAAARDARSRRSRERRCGGRRSGAAIAADVAARAGRRRARCQDPHAPRTRVASPGQLHRQLRRDARRARRAAGRRGRRGRARVTGTATRGRRRSERRPQASEAYTRARGRLHRRVRRPARVLRRSRRCCSACSRKRSALEILDWKPTRSPEVEAENEIDDVEQMIAAQNEIRAPARQAASARSKTIESRVARVLIVPCGCRGRALARELRAAGHAVRGTTRDAAHAAAIAEAGAEPYVGDPDRIATLMEALHGVTIVVLADRRRSRTRPARRPAADDVREARRHARARRRLRRHARRARRLARDVLGDLADPARGARDGDALAAVSRRWRGLTGS